HRESTALLRGTDVDLYVSEWQEKKIENIIPGVITGMYMESFKGHLNIYVDIGGITILSVMAPERADHLRVLPGKKIWVAFPASALRWL
ncbi:MAG TPA: TOBE domain-containing protein, partial [Syntrophales bacterium]|nr:TOBE domain-containing protein [Syntrophales bacterium]HPQ60702.1 TOBE domain-containing protein [Syntrophales bacterium]